MAASFYDSKIKFKPPIQYDLSVRDQVNRQMGKMDTTFGFEHYNPRKMERDLIKPKLHLVPKQKRETFMLTEPKLFKINPGPDKYPISEMTSKENWQLKFPKKFPREKRNSYVD